MQLRN
jgi:hypothetical protein